ncbi:hypothetical protein N7499_006052 [Penicillium canescens]|nr:hypothetical protein N7499_006052 [Penicillium canescens]KAJ6177025.1 hypothetical protein N7485_003939 [Penicillium canescens]
MKYSVPILLALRSQHTEVNCKWTSQAIHCRSKPLNRSKKPVLSENPQNRSNKGPAKPRPGKKVISKAKSQSRAAQDIKTSGPTLSTTDTGFAQFLQKHTSPKHQRVTAGGKIVPMELPNPRLEGISPVLMVVMDDDPSVVGRIFLGDKAVAGRQADGSGDDRRNSFSSDEDTLRIYGETSRSISRLYPADPLYLDLRVPPRRTHSPITDDVPLQQVPRTPLFVPDPNQPSFIQLGFSLGSRSRFEWYADDRAERWLSWAYEIQEEEFVMQAFVLRMRSLDNWPGVDFYRRYIRCAWICGPVDTEEAEVRLRHKLSVHEKWLADVNEAIALDPWSRPDGRSLHHRIYNTNERARILAALEELEGIRDIQADMNLGEHSISGTNTSTFRESTMEPAVQDGSHAPADSPDDGVSNDGPNDISFVSHARVTGPVTIIDPHTCRPIDLQGLQQKAKKRDASGHGHANGGGAHLGQRKGLAEVNSEMVSYDSIGETTGTPIPVGSMDRSLDIGQSSGQAVKELTESDNGTFLAENNQLTSWIPQEILTDSRPVRKRVSSKTVPRNFGRHRYGPGLQTITEIEQEFFSPDENEVVAVIVGSRTVSSPVMRRQTSPAKPWHLRDTNYESSSGQKADPDTSDIASQKGQEAEVKECIERIARGKVDGESKTTGDDNGGLQDDELVMGSSAEASVQKPSAQRQRNRSRSIGSQTIILTDTLSASSLNENETLQFDLEDLSDSSCTSEIPLLSNPYPSPHIRARLTIKPSYPTVLSSLLIQLHAPHTAPAIVLTSKIEVYASFAMSYRG